MTLRQRILIRLMMLVVPTYHRPAGWVSWSNIRPDSDRGPMIEVAGKFEDGNIYFRIYREWFHISTLE